MNMHNRRAHEHTLQEGDSRGVERRVAQQTCAEPRNHAHRVYMRAWHAWHVDMHVRMHERLGTPASNSTLGPQVRTVTPVLVDIGPRVSKVMVARVTTRTKVRLVFLDSVVDLQRCKQVKGVR